MHHFASTCRTVTAIAALNLLLIVLTVDAASAHAGHSHADDGIGTVTLMEVGGAVLLLGVVYLVVSHFYQARDAGASRTDAPTARPDADQRSAQAPRSPDV